MHILLTILQVLLALHTLMGALWKFSNSATAGAPTLGAIPHGVWLALAVIEILCAVGLVAPLIARKHGIAISVAASVIMLEMFGFCALHLNQASFDGSVVYWLVVAVLAGGIAYGRTFVRRI